MQNCQDNESIKMNFPNHQPKQAMQPLFRYLVMFSPSTILIGKQNDFFKVKRCLFELRPVSGIPVVASVKIKIATAEHSPLQLPPCANPPPKKVLQR